MNSAHQFLAEVQKCIPFVGLARLAAGTQVGWGQPQWAQTQYGLCSEVHGNSQVFWIDQHLNIHTEVNVRRHWDNLEDLCTSGSVPWNTLTKTQQALDILKPLGAGISFNVVNHTRFNPTLFVQTVEQYQCHTVVAQRIATDLLTTGERSTTVQQHLVARWDDLQRDLKKCGVHIKRIVPRPVQRTNSMSEISQKVEALQQQYARKKL